MSDNLQESANGLRSGELFDKCVIKTCGGRSIRCCLGLWAVSAPDAENAEREAWRYWQQYYADGEYQKHLSNVRMSEGADK